MIKRLLKYLSSNLYETNIKEDFLKAMNELLYNTLYDRETELDKSIEAFYYDEFSKYRKETKKGEPVVYSNLLYEANYYLVSRIIENKGSLSKITEDQAVNGKWLLGESFYNHKISNETYIWLWHIVYLISDNNSYVKNYWETTSSFFNDSVFNLYYDYDEEIKVENKKLREEEKKRFLEFQYVFVGLLLIKKKYNALNFVLTHTRSIPAEYPLLPKNIHEIFQMFKYFNQDFRSFHKGYYYPEVDWVNSEESIKKWVNTYIAILFLREYLLKNIDSYPVLNQDEYSIYQKRKMIDDLPILIDTLKTVLKNKELLKNLEFLYLNGEEKFPQRKDTSVSYLENFIPYINNSIETEIANSYFKKESVDKFNEYVEKYFVPIFNKIDEFKNTTNFNGKTEINKYYINGFRKIVSKSPFIEGDTYYLNFQEAYANAWALNVNSKFIETFILSKTRSYLFKKEDFEKAIKKLNIDDNYVVIGINLKMDIRQEVQLKYSNYKEINIDYSNISNVLYILRKSDLPYIEYKELNPDEKKDYKLNEFINEDYKIYSKVLDLNIEVGLRTKLIKENNIYKDSDLIKSALMVVALNTEIIWKKDAEVVQLSLQSQYTMDRGVLDDIDDLIPFKIIK